MAQMTPYTLGGSNASRFRRTASGQYIDAPPQLNPSANLTTVGEQSQLVALGRMAFGAADAAVNLAQRGVMGGQSVRTVQNQIAKMQQSLLGDGTTGTRLSSRSFSAQPLFKTGMSLADRQKNQMDYQTNMVGSADNDFRQDWFNKSVARNIGQSAGTPAPSATPSAPFDALSSVNELLSNTGSGTPLFSKLATKAVGSLFGSSIVSDTVAFSNGLHSGLDSLFGNL